MKATLVLTALFVGACMSAPLSQLFDPFGDFLQGNILNSEDVFYASEDFSILNKLFAVSIYEFFQKNVPSSFFN